MDHGLWSMAYEPNTISQKWASLEKPAVQKKGYISFLGVMINISWTWISVTDLFTPVLSI